MGEGREAKGALAQWITGRQSYFLNVPGAPNTDDLSIVSYAIDERLGEPYRIDLTLTSPVPLARADYLNRPARFTIEPPGLNGAEDATRKYGGCITSFGQVRKTRDFVAYQDRGRAVRRPVAPCEGHPHLPGAVCAGDHRGDSSSTRFLCTPVCVQAAPRLSETRVSHAVPDVGLGLHSAVDGANGAFLLLPHWSCRHTQARHRRSRDCLMEIRVSRICMYIFVIDGYNRIHRRTE
jgi:hypothetical protein